MPTTVAELSTTRPRSIGVLQRHGIDFCCGGSQALEDACAAAGVSVAALLGEVDAAERAAGDPGVRWDREPLEALVGHLLERYHAPLRSDLETLEALAEKVHRVHGDKDQRLGTIRDRVLALRADLLLHLAKEEQILFPWTLRADAPAPRGPVAVMLREHDAAADILRELAALTDGYRVPEGACRTWTGLWETLERVDRELREHVALENNVLFPRALDR